MSAIPYRLSTTLAQEVFRFPSRVYHSLLTVLIAGDGLGLIIHFADKDCKSIISPQLSYFVVRHVCLRTFQFYKIFEFIRIADIIEGIPSIGIAGAPYRETSVKNILRELTEFGLLIRLELPRSKAVTPLYGLNVPLALNFFSVYWENTIFSREIDSEGTGSRARSIWSRRNQNVLQCLCEYFESYKRLFSFLGNRRAPIGDFEGFILSLKNQFSKPPLAAGENGEIVYKLKSALRVRKRDIMPQKWRGSGED